MMFSEHHEEEHGGYRGEIQVDEHREQTICPSVRMSQRIQQDGDDETDQQTGADKMHMAHLPLSSLIDRRRLFVEVCSDRVDEDVRQEACIVQRYVFVNGGALKIVQREGHRPAALHVQRHRLSLRR